MSGFRQISGNINVPSGAKFNQFKMTLPIILANMTKNHFVGGFRSGGRRTNKSLRGWKARSPKARRNQGRAILVDTSALKKDVQVRLTTFRRIVVGTSPSVPYGVYHNEGAGNLPQREFIGRSTALESLIKKKINSQIKKLF